MSLEIQIPADLLIHKDPVLVLIEFCSIAILGLALGSFATALIHRVPRGLPWISGRVKQDGKDVSAFRSACPHCKTNLGPWDLIPIFSWLFMRGKCRYCKAPISIQYPIVEFGTVLSCLGAYAALGFGSSLFFVLAILPFLWALLVIDIERMILPNQLVLIVGVVGLLRLVYFAYDTSFYNLEGLALTYGFGAFLYGGLSWFLGWAVGKILKKDALGFGDVKFFIVAGLWLGVPGLALFCLVAGALGITLALLWKALFQKKVFPFGPALITSLYLLLIFEGSLFL